MVVFCYNDLSMAQLIIPSKIHVGFNQRSDTFTGKLGFITYEKPDTGEIAQKNSWEGWRDSKLKPMSFDNTPSRFVFNKGVTRSSGHFSSGRSMVRIYDERDFEFEITVDNMLDILMESDVSKRDIQQECVFAWQGPKVYLLPVNSPEYQEAMNNTKKRASKFSMKDLVPGRSYELKKMKTPAMYLGYYEFFDKLYRSYEYRGKKHVFYGAEYEQSKDRVFMSLEGKDIAFEADESVHPDFQKHLEQFLKSKHHNNQVIRVTRKAGSIPDGTMVFYRKSEYEENQYEQASIHVNGKTTFNKVTPEVVNGEIVVRPAAVSRYSSNYYAGDVRRKLGYSASVEKSIEILKAAQFGVLEYVNLKD